MRICYTILCHKNGKQVASLIEQLDDEDVFFCIHVDKKAGLLFSPRSNVYFVDDDNRIDVKWGEMGIVSATLELIKLALQHGPFDYIALLSGQDFPIKSNAKIKEFLTLHSGTNFIDVKTNIDTDYKKMLKRVELYYPKWMQYRNFFAKIAKRLYILASGGSNCTFRIFRRNLPCNLNYAYGSTWWFLTYECIKWINQFVEDHGEMRTFFENSLVPDECFFQMLFVNSPYVGTGEKNLTYVEWENNRNHPRILTKDDVPMLLKQKHLFAHKFDENTASDAINLLIDWVNR